MRLTKEFITDAAQKEGGFQPDFIEKSLRLMDVLREVRKHNALKDRLVLKGGTAINFMQKELPRLSVDLDFNCLATGNRAEIEPIRKEIIGAFQHVATAMKYDVRQVVDEPAGAVHDLYYQNIHAHRDHIQVDINFMNRVSLFGERIVPLQPFQTQPAVSTLILTQEELFGGKIKALLERSAPRDLYDVYRLVKDGNKIDAGKLHQATLVFCLTINGDFRTYTANRIENISDKSMWVELYPTLRKADRPNRRTMTKAVMPLLKRLLKFSCVEKKLMARFYAGDFNPESAFAGDLLDKVRNHPGLQWQLLKRQRRPRTGRKTSVRIK